MIHAPMNISDRGDDVDKVNIIRTKGFIGQVNRYPDVLHHLLVVYNGEGKARLVYKFKGTVQFIKNTAHDS